MFEEVVKINVSNKKINERLKTVIINENKAKVLNQNTNLVHEENGENSNFVAINLLYFRIENVSLNILVFDIFIDSDWKSKKEEIKFKGTSLWQQCLNGWRVTLNRKLNILTKNFKGTFKYWKRNKR